MVSSKVCVRADATDAFLFEVNVFLSQLEAVSSDCLFVSPERDTDQVKRTFRLRAGKNETLARCIEHLNEQGVCVRGEPHPIE